MKSFDYKNPVTIHFGEGKLQTLGNEVLKFGKRCMLVTTTKEEEVLRPLFEEAISILKAAGLYVYHFDGVIPNPTIQSVERASEIVKKEKIEVVVGLGGGSSIDTSKAIALFSQTDEFKWDTWFNSYGSPFEEYEIPGKICLPLISIPTTSGTGSEVTQGIVLSDETNKEKLSIFHPRAFPLETIIDPKLTYSLPKRLTAITGFDAFSHAFESYMRNEGNPLSAMQSLFAMEGIINTLPLLINDLSNLELRSKMSTYATVAGIALSNNGATIPHPLSEVITGINPRIPHGQSLACVYPGYVEYVQKKDEAKCEIIRKIFTTTDKDLVTCLKDFISSIELDKSLKELGFREKEVELLLNHPVLDHLPFASKEDLVGILNKTK